MTKTTCEHSGIEFESKDGWISVKKQLPPEGSRILCFTSEGELNDSFYMNDKRGLGFYYSMACNCNQEQISIMGNIIMNGLLQIKNVTHWMPLPEPPDNEDD